MTSEASEKTETSPGRKFPLKLWIGVPFALFLVLLIILSQIDLESVKEELVQRISTETGLSVEIDSMGFGFSNGLGLQCKGVKVSTPTGDRFSVNRIHLLAEWGPLLKGELKIKSATLEHPEITLEIPEASPVKIPPSVKEKPTVKPSNELIAPKTIQTATDKLKNSRLSIGTFEISNGEITLIRSSTQKRLSFNVDGTVVMNQEENLDISAKAIRIQTGSVIFEGDGKASNMTTENAAVSMNLNSSKFSWKDLQPALQFFDYPTKNLPIQSVDVDQLLIKAEMPLNSLVKIDTLKQQLAGHVELKTKNTILAINNKNYSIESLIGEGTWDKGVLTHNFSGIALGSDFSLKGKLPFSNLGKDSTSHIEWKNLALEKLPLEKGLAWSPTQGKTSGSLSLTGPLPNDKETFPGRLNGEVNFHAEGLVLKSEKESDLIKLDRLQGHGSFNQGQLQHEISGTIWGSEFNIKGKFPLNKNIPILSSQINWKGLDLAQLPPTTGWNPSEGELSGTLTVEGPLPAEGKSFAGNLKGSFEAKNLKLQNTKNSQSLSLSNFNGSGEFENNQVNYKLKGGTFNGTFSSEGRVTLSATTTRPPVLNNRIEFANLDLSQLPIAIKPNSGKLSGTLQLSGPLPEPENLLTGKLKIDTTFKVANLKMSDPPLEIQALSGKGVLKNGTLTHDLKGNLFGGKVSTKGSLAFHKNKERTLITANSNLILGQVALDWLPLFTQNEWAPTSGTVTGNMSIKGLLPSEGKVSPTLKLKGTLKGNKLVLGDPQRQIGSLKLAFKESSSTLTQVQVDLEKIKLEDRSFKKASGLFQITPEKIDLTGGRVWPMSGLINLVGDLKPASGNYRLKFKGDKLKVEEFLSPHLTGPLKLSGALTGTLPQNVNQPGLPDYARNLSGDVKIKLVDGTLPELGTLKNVLTLLNPTSALNKSTEGMACELLQGDFKIIKGVVHTSNLEMKSPQLTMGVEGKANLVEDTVLAEVKAMPLQMLDKTLKAIPLLGQILTGGKKGGLIETYFKVEGKLSKPDVTMQPHKSLLKKPGSILKELFNVPKNLTGGE
jgi:hypothetical protein